MKSATFSLLRMQLCRYMILQFWPRGYFPPYFSRWSLVPFSRRGRERRTTSVPVAGRERRTFPERRRSQNNWTPSEWTELLTAVIRPSDRIVLLRVKLESPGAWEFLGSLNPLEVIRHWLADNHERRKDKEYREAAERERLRLENRLLENRVIRERIQTARELGATDDDLAPLLNELILKPLNAISQQQSKGLIQGVNLQIEKEQE